MDHMLISHITENIGHNSPRPVNEWYVQEDAGDFIALF